MKNTVKLNESQLRKIVAESVKKALKEGGTNNADFDMPSEAVLEAKRIINGKPFDEIIDLPNIDKRFSYGALNGSEGEGLIDLNFKDILVTVRDNNGVATIVSYEQYNDNDQFIGLNNVNESNIKNIKKNTVKLNESQLRKIVTESVKKVLNETTDYVTNAANWTVSELVGVLTHYLNYEDNAQVMVLINKALASWANQQKENTQTKW